MASIMDQPAQTLSWAEQVEEEVSANMVPTQQAHDVEATKAIPMAYKVSPEASETNSKASKVNLEASEMPPPKPPKVAPIFKRPIGPKPQVNHLLKKLKSSPGAQTITHFALKFSGYVSNVAEKGPKNKILNALNISVFNIIIQ